MFHVPMWACHLMCGFNFEKDMHIIEQRHKRKRLRGIMDDKNLESSTLRYTYAQQYLLQ